jgi:GNAT superfamily N-acetyltransferase
MQGGFFMSTTQRDQDIEGIKQAVYADTFAAAPPAILQLPLTLMHDSGTMWGIAAGIEAYGWSGFFNQVLGLGLATPATPTLVDAILTKYRDTRISFSINLSPHAQPLQLSHWLHQHNLVHQHWLAQWYRTVPASPTRAPTTPFAIERIDAANALRFVETAAIGLPPALHPWVAALVGRAGWSHYLAYRDDRPVAGAALFIQDGVGYLTWTGTQPAARSQGAQTALIAHRLHEASACGCRSVVAETFETTLNQPGVSGRNLVRAGFQIAYYNALYEE